MRNLVSSAAILAIFCVLPVSAQETATAKYKVNFYGNIKSDVSYDVHGVTGDDYTQYVSSKKDLDRDFRSSAKGTRFGLDITDGDKVSAKIETDFLEDVAANTNAGLRLRHAYVTLKAGKFDILTGQTWHLLPLEFSGTNNEFAMGYSGVLWMRAPQLRATYRHSDTLTFAGAIVRPTRKLYDAEGTASGLPQAQAQAQLKVGKAKFTLMGALGQWRKSTGEKGEVKLVDLGYNIPLAAILTLNGQIWTGQNLYDFLGGIGQNQYGTSAVKASGGFANVSIKPAGRFFYNVAYGIDNPVDTQLAAAAAAKTKNTTLLANAGCLVYEKVTVTLEAARQVTEYKLTTGYEDVDNLHYQLSFKFPF
ncbi:MAG: hypothetical protein A2234_08170 [Elusimicrobia bacterium RIFOXYA2_FULL_58_8]|nr:MAG: hypothetical protein A2234_08170 [Elusimicrobia bacterium RIFOXYA2_FULL_58_8]